MEVQETYLHCYKGNGSIAKYEPEKFYNRLKLILTYSLVSYNYYQKFILDKEGSHYYQNWPSSVHGYSKNYVSLLDPNIFLNPQGDMTDPVSYVEYPGCFVVLNRSWIKNEIAKTKKDLSRTSKFKVVDREILYSVCGDSSDWSKFGIPYVIQGEVKIRDRIPLEEICGLAFGENTLEGSDDITFLHKILVDVGISLPIYLLECDANYDKAENLRLTKIL